MLLALYYFKEIDHICGGTHWFWSGTHYFLWGESLGLTLTISNEIAVYIYIYLNIYFYFSLCATLIFKGDFHGYT